MKKKITIILAAILLLCTIVGIVGYNKNKEVQPQPIVFDETEAFRYGKYQIGMDLFMLYALDIAPDFVSSYGSNCWTQETIDLGWITATPQEAFILYTTDIMLSAIACDIYYQAYIGELDEQVTALCKESSSERYKLLTEAGVSNEVLTEEVLYNYECSNYRLSYVISKFSETYDNDQTSMQAAILGLRNAVDSNFDYNNNINWDLVKQIDYSVAAPEVQSGSDGKEE